MHNNMNDSVATNINSVLPVGLNFNSRGSFMPVTMGNNSNCCLAPSSSRSSQLYKNDSFLSADISKQTGFYNIDNGMARQQVRT